MKRIVMASAILLALTGAPALAELQVFPLPEYAGHRIDLCRVWGSECGQPAADEFCRRQGYTSAEGFTIDHDIGSATATRTLVDGGICNQQFCDGFESITCTRPGPVCANRHPRNPRSRNCHHHRHRRLSHPRQRPRCTANLPGHPRT